ncbi:MAG: tRNA 4-thiouridine(8) synthase ThiI [Clostridia bacterium]|nr:tRNA 4-thiouridine(8) synthase ThiI [Clostridia bacterium]
MEKVIIIRYGEIFLKGKNRDFFESLLIKNIKFALKDIDCKFVRAHGRYFVENFAENFENEIVEKLLAVFGVYSISVAFKAVVCEEDNFLAIKELAFELISDNEKFLDGASFRVTVKRADKRLSMNSTQIASDIGGYILSKSNLKVDLFSFEIEISVDIRENGFAFVYSDVLLAVGGLPVGCSGNAMLMLSGGIDSPVAAYMMSKRGTKIFAVHFSSPPYTSDMAKEKVRSLRTICEKYCTEIKLMVVPFTEIQLEIHKQCPAEYMITIMRRFMMRIAEKLAIKDNCGAIITGESLGQVASQTMQSINCTNAVATIPVFRPLIGFDKQEIMNIANKIGTYETSILPYEDCCTIFLPKSPAIKPQLRAVERAESVLEIDELIVRAIEGIEIC